MRQRPLGRTPGEFAVKLCEKSWKRAIRRSSERPKRRIRGIAKDSVCTEEPPNAELPGLIQNPGVDRKSLTMSLVT